MPFLTQFGGQIRAFVVRGARKMRLVLSKRWRVLQNRAANALDDDAAALVVKLEAECHELVNR